MDPKWDLKPNGTRTNALNEKNLQKKTSSIFTYRRVTWNDAINLKRTARKYRKRDFKERIERWEKIGKEILGFQNIRGYNRYRKIELEPSKIPSEVMELEGGLFLLRAKWKCGWYGYEINWRWDIYVAPLIGVKSCFGLWRRHFEEEEKYPLRLTSVTFWSHFIQHLKFLSVIDN